MVMNIKKDAPCFGFMCRNHAPLNNIKRENISNTTVK